MPNTISEASQRRLNKLLGAAAARTARARLADPPAVRQRVTRTPALDSTIAQRELTQPEEELRATFGGTRLEQPLIQRIAAEGRPDPARMISIADLLQNALSQGDR